MTSLPERLPSPSSVVVVGAGLAGAGTASALRARGYTGRLTVLGAEGLPPYDRPPLSKQLYSRTEPTWLTEDLGIDLGVLTDELLLDDPAVSLRTGDGGARVTTRSGRVLDAEAVVLACGSEPVRPAGWEHAVTLHSAADADALRARAVSGARLVCVGAGWIGAEVAGAAAGVGVDVTVVEAASTPLARQLGTVVGSHLAPWYTAAGVRLLTSTTVDAVDPDGIRLRTTGASSGIGGTLLPADVVLAAVGARPATAWLAGSDLALDTRGTLLVDETGRVLPATGSHHGAVLAVGDCATRADPRWSTVPGGHWSGALHDPDLVARTLLGDDEGPAAHTPYVFSSQLGHDLALVGLPDPLRDTVTFRGDPTASGSGWLAFYLRPDGAVTGILVVDSPRDVSAARRLLADGPAVLDLAGAADPTVPLRSIRVAAVPA